MGCGILNRNYFLPCPLTEKARSPQPRAHGTCADGSWGHGTVCREGSRRRTGQTQTGGDNDLV